MEYNVVIHGDSDRILRQLINEGQHFDLICTDPPYNLNKDFGNDTDKLEISEYLSITKKRIELCKKLLNPNGSIVWFGIHNYIGYIQTMMYDAGLNYRRLNIWYYKNGFSRSTKSPLAEYEPFLWFSNSDKNWTYNLDDVRMPYRSQERLKSPVYYKDSKGTRKAWVPNEKGSMRGDVWEFPTLAGSLYQKERTDHPTQKPEALITEIIKAFCPKDVDGHYHGTILDPFLGSGTLAVCCEKLNKQGHDIKWVGIEIEQHWCDVSNERIDNIRNGTN